jgi:hypothetical protein
MHQLPGVFEMVAEQLTGADSDDFSAYCFALGIFFLAQLEHDSLRSVIPIGIHDLLARLSWPRQGCNLGCVSAQAAWLKFRMFGKSITVCSHGRALNATTTQVRRDLGRDEEPQGVLFNGGAGQVIYGKAGWAGRGR